MSRLAVALAGVLVIACAPAADVRPPSTQTVGRSAGDISILVGDGTVMRPIANGGRVPLGTGWATLRFSPVPLGEDGQLQVAVFDGEGKPVDADVSVDYASLDMDHGHMVERGVFHENCYQMRLSFAMPGRWRLLVHVVRGASEDTVTVLLPEVGL